MATPGRLLDLLDRKAFVLDEADEVQKMGFRKELAQICEITRSRQATWLFSATIPEGVKWLITDYMSPVAHTLRIAEFLKSLGEGLQFIIATDVPVRGIDVEGLVFVMHHQRPDQMDYYTHRTGRAGRKGGAIAFVEHEEKRQYREAGGSAGIEFLGHEVGRGRRRQ